ncbi:MAG: PepSY-associated TM helix domain-containing protein [Isosphaeraceae bacterium]
MTATAHRRTLRHRFLAFMRWLHIYLSMFCLAVVLFFSITGLTLNHPGWFGANAVYQEEFRGTLDARWLKGNGSVNDPDPARQVDRLAVVEALRAAHGIGGAVSEFRVDDRECLVTFKGPGHSADAFIDRESGRYDLEKTSHGLVAILNDLHKGRDSGPTWSVLVDASAAFLTIISLTGMVLLLYLKVRRKPGLIVAVAGTLALLALAYLFVP